MKTIPGFKTIKEFPPGEPIVSMVQFRNRLLVATSKSVFQYDPDDDKWRQLEFVVQDETKPPDAR